MTLGEIAYNAYCEAVDWVSVKGDPLPSWSKQSETLKQAWEAAAHAVKTWNEPKNDLKQRQT